MKQPGAPLVLLVRLVAGTDSCYVFVITGTITKPQGAAYTFKVVVEPDDDVWHADCPALVAYGAATWGETREEALAHIRVVVGLVVIELREDGEAVPADAEITEGTLVSVIV